MCTSDEWQQHVTRNVVPIQIDSDVSQPPKEHSKEASPSDGASLQASTGIDSKAFVDSGHEIDADINGDPLLRGSTELGDTGGPSDSTVSSRGVDAEGAGASASGKGSPFLKRLQAQQEKIAGRMMPELGGARRDVTEGQASPAALAPPFQSSENGSRTAQPGAQPDGRLPKAKAIGRVNGKTGAGKRPPYDSHQELGTASSRLPAADANPASEEASSSMDESSTGHAPESAENGAASTRGPGSHARPWWLSLDTVHVPMLKCPGEQGGKVQLNFARLPDSKDFKAILFEDEEDAKEFLGVVGPLVGVEGTLVGLVASSPSDFLRENPSFDAEKDVVVLCKGTLRIKRGLKYEQVLNGVRMAQMATAMKHGEEDRLREERVGQRVEGVDDVLEDLATEVVDLGTKAIQEMIQKEIAKKGGNGGEASSGQSQVKGSGSRSTRSDPQSTTSSKTSQGAGATSDVAVNGDGANASVSRNGTGAPKHSPEIGASSNGLGTASDAPRSVKVNMSPTVGTKEGAEQDNMKDIPKNGIRASAKSDAMPSVPLSRSGKGSDRDSDVVEPIVIHPPSGRDGRKGPRWFSYLRAIFMMMYIDNDGQSTVLAFKDNDSGIAIAVGFQDRYDASHCLECMKLWEDHDATAVAVVPIDPQSVIDMCDELDVRPAVFRKGSVPMWLGMTRDEFSNNVVLLSMAQSGDFGM